MLNNIRGINKITKEIQISNNYPNENDVIASLELAGNIHKEVRRYLQPKLKVGVKLIDIAHFIEEKTKELSNQNKSINKGIGFPVGLALNNCAAHWHPESDDDNTTFKKDDVLKIDFGVEVNSWIVDSAFTITANPKYDILLKAVKEATETGIKNAGVDVIINEWSASIKEVMESYEIDLDNNKYKVRPITNLGGHNIVKGIIHGGIFLPPVPSSDKNLRFKEGVYAIETFGSTGEDKVKETGESSLFRLNPNNQNLINVYKMETIKKFANKIRNNFKTLPFTNRYVKVFDVNRYKDYLKILTNNKILYSYPPLCIDKGYTAQYEHTIYISENKKIVFSNGEDY